LRFFWQALEDVSVRDRTDEVLRSILERCRAVIDRCRPGEGEART
jgi:hypothetical protein